MIFTMRRTTTALLCLLLAGCAGGKKIVKKTDDITGRTVERMTGNRIGPIPCDLTADPCVFLEAERITVRGGPARFRLVAIYEGEEWLFIQPGKSLEFELRDSGQSFALYGRGSKEHRKILGDKKLRESAYYDISPNNLMRLSEAGKVRMKLHGDGFFVERGFSSGNRKNLKAFAQKFLGK
jgi:hypothetical protein